MYPVSIIQKSKLTNLIKRVGVLELKTIISENAANYSTFWGCKATRLSQLPSFKISQNYVRNSLDKNPFYATFTGHREVVDFNVYDRVCEETLESLTEYFEELLDESKILQSADITYSSGVLTINLGNKFGTYVINRQAPNRQIWLSSPLSGPKRYDLVASEDPEGEEKYWVYKHDSRTLHQLLQDEISKVLDVKVDFSKCSYSKL